MTASPLGEMSALAMAAPMWLRLGLAVVAAEAEGVAGRVEEHPDVLLWLGRSLTAESHARPGRWQG